MPGTEKALGEWQRLSPGVGLLPSIRLAFSEQTQRCTADLAPVDLLKCEVGFALQQQLALAELFRCAGPGASLRMHGHA